MISLPKKIQNFGEDFPEKVKLLSTSRIFIASAFLIATIVIHPGGRRGDIYKAFLFVTILHLIMSFLFFFLEYVLSSRRLYRFAFMQIAWDIIFHTCMIYLSGGINSQFKFLYWFSILYASILFLRSGAFIAAGLSSLCYAFLIDLEYFETVPKLYASFTHISFVYEKAITYSIVQNSLIFFLLAFVASAITTRLHQAEQTVSEKEKHVLDLERKVMRSRHLASVGEMAAKIAHEIRNPLTSISASMEMLSKKEEEDSSQTMILEIAKKEAKRLNVLITDFLNFAKPSSLERREEKLSEVLQESIQVFRHGYPNIEIEFKNKINSEKKIQIDSKMTIQLLWNVLKNAAESMEEKGKIEIEMQKAFDESYVVEVKDEGKGIEIDEKDKLYEPFFSTKPKGTGLGLSVAYRIMEDHGGSIELFSTQGTKGAICKLIFPTKI